MLLTLSLAVIIGLLLGLLGGGGSILTVPMLVYVLHIEPKIAIVTSFMVVGVSSLMALIPHARRGSVCWKSGVFFGLAGMGGAFSGGQMAAHFSGDVLMSLFGLISLITGVLMLHRQGRDNLKNEAFEQPLQVCPRRVPFARVLFDGFFVGGLTGLVGVGGGFLIVPALTLLVGLPMQGAVGTSLLIIVMNALAGLSGYSQHVELNWALTGLITIGAISGSAVGAWVSAYIKPAALRQVFGAMVILVAVYVLSQSVNQALLTSVEQCLANTQVASQVLAGLFLVLLLLRIGRWIHKADSIVLTPHQPLDGGQRGQ